MPFSSRDLKRREGLAGFNLECFRLALGAPEAGQGDSGSRGSCPQQPGPGSGCQLQLREPSSACDFPALISLSASF